MRDRTAAMDSAAAADWVSREFLESTFALRMRQLADDPTIPLFFGRLDMASTGSTNGQSRGSTVRATKPARAAATSSTSGAATSRTRTGTRW